eukprot:jgi/Astpho2/7053/fgenesh1_pm.00107_%23_29_t
MCSWAAGNSGLHVQLDSLDGEHEHIFSLSLTRATAKNAIGRQLLSELRDAVAMLSRERSTRCLVVKSGVAGSFCAGADLKERASMTQQEASEFVSALRATFSALEALPMPSVAIVDGVALGGGAELALACDLRVAGDNAIFAFPETRLGIIPGAGGTQRLPRVVGRTKAKELIFTGSRLDARRAYDIGLVDRLAQPGTTAEQEGLALAKDIAQGGPIALRMAKAAINHGLGVDTNTGLQLEESYYAQVLTTQDRIEGLKSFAEKRKPVFDGT